jgi:hypothetical protein
MSVQLHAPDAMYLRGKSLWFSLDRRLGGRQNQCGHCGEGKPLDLTGTRTPTPLAYRRYRVTVPTAIAAATYADVLFITGIANKDFCFTG